MRPNLARLAIAGFGAVCVAVAFGITPFFDAVTASPLSSHIAHNERLLAIALLCVALLAGWGLERLLSERAPPRRRIALALAGAVAVVPVLWVVGRARRRCRCWATRSTWPGVSPPAGDARARGGRRRPPGRPRSCSRRSPPPRSSCSRSRPWPAGRGPFAALASAYVSPTCSARAWATTRRSGQRRRAALTGGDPLPAGGRRPARFMASCRGSRQPGS